MRPTPGPLDEQQVQLVERLRAAAGAPVSFDELRAIGIENPALLCYELAAVGLPSTRTCSPGEGMPALSVRLEPQPERQKPEPDVSHPPRTISVDAARAPRPTPRALDAPPARVRVALNTVPARGRILRKALEGALARARQALPGASGELRVLWKPLDRAVAQSLDRLASAASAIERRVRRAGQTTPQARPRALIAIAALALTLLSVVAIVLGNQGGNEATHVRSANARGHSAHKGISARSAGYGQAAPTTAPPAHASGVPALPPSTAAQTRISPAEAQALEAQGHQLLAEGSYANAIRRLSAAIGASGQSLAACALPASEACLTFAYALYDLGRALRLEGHHAEAIAVLSERLRIDNQRPTVQHELELARGAPA